ncbi:hypothetical protein FRACYDRAFT_240908 [Fragilariopsis cylindrus CCMP1102]|uniref:Uncharacterized protein n=1 Tax=Fragilariopsis cylindrus CCMP1102 TaxID=635003 RepID=A0A1E7F881_9STRA|nr:hypothetical protein FRACYDRAFT_240908 [Fragilariopsis cylindrus CCMP1102]|eukprot:OEU14366.1 hypothetical protein FRACYDRAFT_240908 [Fragilariopsis cylindrus CCMP1102]
MAITVTTADNVHKQEAQVVNANYDEDFIPGAKYDGDNNINNNSNSNSNCAFVVDSSGKSCMTTDYGVIVLKRSYRKKPQRQRPTEHKMSSSANTSLLLCTTFCQFTAITNWVEKNTGMKEFCGRSSSVLKNISMMDNVIDEEEEEVEDGKKSNSRKKKMKKKLSLNFRIIKKSFVDYVLKM